MNTMINKKVGCGTMILLNNELLLCGDITKAGTIAVCLQCAELSKELQPDVEIKYQENKYTKSKTVSDINVGQ